MPWTDSDTFPIPPYDYSDDDEEGRASFGILLGEALLYTFVMYITATFFLTVWWGVVRRHFERKAIKVREASAMSMGTPFCHSPGNRHRITMMPAGIGADDLDFEQKGYTQPPLGRMIYLMWIGFCFLTQAAMGMIIGTFYIDEKEGRPLYAAFLFIFYPSAVLLAICTEFPDRFQTLFLAPCMLEEAQYIWIEASGTDPANFNIGFRGRSDWWRLDRKYTLAKVQVEEGFQSRRWFSYASLDFVWSKEDQRFRPVGTRDLHGDSLPRNGLDSETAGIMLQDQSLNTLDLPVPSIRMSLFNEFRNLLYLGNLYYIWLGLMCSHWVAGLVYLMVTVFSGVGRALFVVRRQQLRIREIARFDETVDVLRDRRWKRMSSMQLVPGDLIRPRLGTVPCDCVIAEGIGIANEAMLTGESVLLQKLPSEILDGKRHCKHMLFAGTQLLQGEGLECVVSATGGLTVKGQLVRMLLCPCEVKFKFNSELPILATILAMISLIYLVVVLHAEHLNSFQKFRIGTFNLAHLANPLLIVSFSAGHAVAAHRLEKRDIRCVDPARIAVAGKLHVMVFDKTGTLTEPGMELEAIWPVSGGPRLSFLSQVRVGVDFLKLVDPLWELAFATCHSLERRPNEEDMLGSELEMRMFSSTGWCLCKDDDGARFFSGDRGNQHAVVLRSLGFEYKSMTSGAMVSSPTCDKDAAALIFIKGSSEEIAKKCSVPLDYEEVITTSAAEGFYILAIAYRTVAHESEVRRLEIAPREELETGLSLLGLILYKNKVNPKAASVLEQMREGRVHCVVCSGDSVASAIAVAKECRLFHPARLLIGDMQDEELVWRREGERCIADIDSESQLAVTGAAFDDLVSNDQLEELFFRIRVFGRMTPEQKVHVVRQFQRRSFVVGMCGDGGNDCAALRAAHVGIALSEAEPAMVAPFTCKSLQSVVEIATLGRACLATNMACCKYFLVSGHTLVSWKTSQIMWGRYPSVWQFIWIEICSTLLFIWAMTACCHAREDLLPRRPSSSFFAPDTIIAVCAPLLFFQLAFGIVSLGLYFQSWNHYPSSAFITYVLKHTRLLCSLADNYSVESTFLLIPPFIASIALAYSIGGSFRRSVLRSIPMLIAQVLVWSCWLALLYTGPNAFTCLFRVNCSNQISARLYIPILSDLSHTRPDGCFYGPRSEEWMPAYNITEAKPYSRLSDQEPLDGKMNAACFPPSDLDLPDIDGARGPNNIMPGHWSVFLIICSASLGVGSIAFINHGVDPLSSYVRTLGQYFGCVGTRSDKLYRDLWLSSEIETARDREKDACPSSICLS